MTFPDRSYGSIQEYMGDYFDRCARAARSVPVPALARAAEILTSAYQDGNTVYACGNGGSAAISNHLLCDHAKCIRTDTRLMPRVVSLATNIEVITAIANDIAYDDVFVYQLENLARPGDVLITISASGDSENVVRAASWARDHGLHTIAMTGFAGGRTGSLAEVHLHVEGDNYGVIEDVHQSLMHILAQYIRQAHMAEAHISERKF
jgi:D-sedoheptulose 7-phosphate isomerase/D-glycero-D-manno-heptose 1,7-bisphosphate phosphatase